MYLVFPLLSVGSEDGKIHVWNGESGMKVAVLDGKHTGPITCLQFNPKFMTFASACSNMVSSSYFDDVLTLLERNLQVWCHRWALLWAFGDSQASVMPWLHLTWWVGTWGGTPDTGKKTGA